MIGKPLINVQIKKVPFALFQLPGSGVSCEGFGC